MCIGVCIGLFFDLNLYNKINALILFIDSYYRTIYLSPSISVDWPHAQLFAVELSLYTLISR